MPLVENAARRVVPVLEMLRLMPLGFRLYQRVSSVGSGETESVDGIPIPSARLLMAVAGSPDRATFLHGGKLAAASIQRILQNNGIEIGTLPAILDFGCGCGRVLRYWKGLPSELHGTDYNADLAQWCARHLPFVQVATNELCPPTCYPDHKFDLIYALSVFTHLPEQTQKAWMAEFHRILRPGGFLIMSLHGKYYLDRLKEREQHEFERGKLITRHGRAAGTNLCCVFHPENHVRQHLASEFEVLDFMQEGALGNPHQDLWLLRKRHD